VANSDYFNGYKYIPNLITAELCDHIVTSLKISGEAGLLVGNRDVENEQVIYAPIALESLLVSKKHIIENIVGESLCSSFSFLWIYKRGAKLPRHIDRGAVDYVLTLNIRSSSNDSWPLFVETNTEIIKIDTAIGDAAVLNGKKWYHWREECPLEWRLQAQLCFIKKDKCNSNKLFDGRTSLGLGPTEKVITTPVQPMILDVDTYPIYDEYKIL